MTLLLGALAIGLILALLGLGVFLSFRVLNFPDITADGSLTLGAALAALMIVSGWDPALATGAAFLAGCAAGALTGVIHTRLGVNGLLSGILVMTALYSVNLHIMGRSNISLLDARTVPMLFGQHWAGQELFIWGWRVPSSDLAVLAGLLTMTSVSAGLLFWFLRTQAGTALRASGDNPQMMRALGVEVHGQIILGLALANGLCAASGALLAQFQGFADVQMGIGMVVWGLASVIIGEALVGRAGIGTLIVGAVMGSVLFRLLVAIALRWGLDPNDLKLVTAVFVLLALMAPRWIRTRSLARTA
jgi:putative ABC transport system permease protein